MFAEELTEASFCDDFSSFYAPFLIDIMCSQWAFELTFGFTPAILVLLRACCAIDRNDDADLLC